MKLVFTADALFAPVPDGGEIRFIDGEPIRSGGLAGAVYILLWGGNQADDGTPESAEAWWGNQLGSDEPIHSRTATLVQGLPMVSGNLRRIEETVEEDLQPLIDDGVATSVEATAGMRSARFLLLEIRVESVGNATEILVYRLNWESGPFEPEQLVS